MNAISSGAPPESCQAPPDAAPARKPPEPNSPNWVENGPYNDFVRRAIRSAGKRVGAHGVEDLGEILKLERALEDAVQEGVTRLREMGYSWSEIARAAGMQRQSAWERWGPGASTTEVIAQP